MEPSPKYALGAGVGASGREVNAPTGLSLLSTYLVDYGYLTPWFAPCQPPGGVVW
jgi:hypothetical protein